MRAGRLLAGLFLLAATGFVLNTSLVPGQVPASGLRAGYVDTRVCAGCHREIAAAYRETGMGRSFYRPTPANSVEDFSRGDHYDALSDTHFSMARRGDQVYQRRWQVGFGAKETNVEELRVDYVMGSGNHARSYLHRTTAGTLIELPLGWFPPGPGGEGGWGMAPGSDTQHPLTRRFISYKCMFCHNGIPGIPAANAGPGADPVYTGEMPEGIDCQRCHGPGAAHILAAGRPGATLATIRAGIVNPSKLAAERSMEVCMQCHLETSSAKIPATIVRFDRGPFSYRPGEPLASFQISFDHAPGQGHDEKFEVVSSVYRLRQAKCFTASAGRMTCVTCHDPHRVPRGEEAARHYSAVCRQCHDARQGSVEPIARLIASGKHPAAPECISCHMPSRRTEDIPRVVMTDHLIRRAPPKTDLLAALPAPTGDIYHGEIVPYYPPSLPRTGESALYRGVAQVGLGNNLERGLPVFAREMALQKPRDPEFHIILGDAWQAAGKSAEAIRAYDDALRLRPDSIRALRALAAALHTSGDIVRAEATLRKGLQLAPNDPELWFRQGLVDADSGRLSAGIGKVRKAIQLDPTLPEKSRRLAGLLLQSGDLEAAGQAVQEALRTNPYDDDAWDLAGRVHSQKGEVPEALFHFERAIRLGPDSVPHLYDLALALARAGRFGDARQRVESALRLDEKFADGHELLAGLYEQGQQLPQAVAEYRRTVELRPVAFRAHWRLGNLLAAQGDRTSALTHLREAAKAADPALAQQAARALQQLGGGK